MENKDEIFYTSNDISCYGDILSLYTDFELLEIKTEHNDKFMSKENRLVRFINDDFFDYNDNMTLNGMFFIPSHIEKRIMRYFEGNNNNNKFPTHLLKYCNEYVKEELNNLDIIDCNSLKETLDKPTLQNISYKDRALKSTSFYKLVNISKDEIIPDNTYINEVEEKYISKMVSDLKKDIHAVRDFGVCIGDVDNSKFGIFEISYNVKTKDPETRHYNFWKYNEIKHNKTFEDLSQIFKIIE